MSDDILRNSAALNALKRNQLLSLSRKYGVKAGGKNVEMVERLQLYADVHASDLDFHISQPTPPAAHHLAVHSPTASELSSSIHSHQQEGATNDTNTLIIPSLNHKTSQMSIQSRPSDSWELLSESDASFITQPHQRDDQDLKEDIGTVGSWKSANNGKSLSDFGGDCNDHHSKRNSLSMKALASSISRRGSIILLGRSTSGSSNKLTGDTMEENFEVQAEQEGGAEQQGQTEMLVDAPPSPASTVGVARRYSKQPLHERPSTVRLCSPAPIQSASNGAHNKSDTDELPFVGKAKDIGLLKERRSMAPLRSSAVSNIPSGLARTSMPALPSSTSARVLAVYPPLPTPPEQYVSMLNLDDAPSRPTPIPEAFPPLPSTPRNDQVFFGNSANRGVSKQQFSDAAQAVLKEMNARLPQGSIKFGEELLKGKEAEMDRLVHLSKDVEPGGWGLQNGKSHRNDRFAEAHQKEFSRMRSISKKLSIVPSSSLYKDTRTVSSASSIQPTMVPLGGSHVISKRKLGASSSTTTLHLPSAPNGHPLHAGGDTEGRQAKRARLSTHSVYGTLEDAKKSLVSFRGEDKSSNHKTNMLKKMKDKRQHMSSSLLARGSSLKFGFLKKKTTLGPHGSDFSCPSPPLNPSVSHPRPLSSTLASDDDTKSLSRSRTTGAHIQQQKDRNRSTSAQTMMSQSSGRTPRRARIPDFVPPLPKGEVVHKASLASTGALGLPKASSMSRPASTMSSTTTTATTERAWKKQSHADLLKHSRPAPLPPAPNAETGLSSLSSSSLGRQGVSVGAEGIERKARLTTSNSTRTLLTSSNPSSRGPSVSSTRQASPASVQTTHSTAASTQLNRQSTLYLPTAASIARMQATVKPQLDRPLPSIPSAPAGAIKPARSSAATAQKELREGDEVEMLSPRIAIDTIQPFGDASSRENAFEVNFMSKATPSLSKGSMGPAKAIAKKGSTASLSGASRVRARSSGVSAVKSRGDLREKEQAIRRKRSELRATIERRKEEKELREMIS